MLFEDNKTRVMSDKILARFKAEFNPDRDYHEEMYNKYYPRFREDTVDIDRLFSMSTEKEIQEISYFMLHKAKQLVSEYINPALDYADLDNLLAVDLTRLPETKDLSMSQGLSFCDHFTKAGRLSCPIAGKGKNTAIKMLNDDYSLYKATLKAFYFHRTGVSPKSVLRTVELLTPVVSNFRPVSACKIWYDRAVKHALDEGRDYVALQVPSEGWLGRLLSSYKIAYDYPQLKVYYLSTDPNPIVKKQGEAMIVKLKEYNNLSNWFPELHMCGSEDFTEVTKEMKERNLKFDVSFTSPPYFDTERYHRGYKLDFHTGDGVISGIYAENETLTVQALNKYENDIETLIPNLFIGARVLVDNQWVTLMGMESTGQSWDKNASQAEWRINFLLATYNCLKKIVKPGGHIITNIANVNTYMTLEDDTIKSMKEAGLDYLGTDFYKLSRKPSKNGDTVITARKGEPMFIAKVK